MIEHVGDLINLLGESNYDGEWETYFYKSKNRRFKLKKVVFPMGLIDSIRVEAIDKYKEKLIQCNNIVEYGSFDDTGNLKELKLENECIKGMYQLFIDTFDGKIVPEVSETNLEEMKEFEFDGYILTRVLNDERIFIFSKSKLVPKRGLEFILGEENTYEKVDNSRIVSLSTKIDFVIVGDSLYSIDYKFEKVFYVGDFLRDKINNIIEELEKTSKFTPASIYAIRNSKSRRQLLKYDGANLELLTKENVDILENYTDIEYKANQIAFEEEYSAKVFIRLMSGKIFFANGKAYVGTKEELHKPVEEVKFED